MSDLNGNNWDLYDEQGLLIRHSVSVREYPATGNTAATIRISGTLHRRDDLDVAINEISSQLADWYLIRGDDDVAAEFFNPVIKP